MPAMKEINLFFRHLHHGRIGLDYLEMGVPAHVLRKNEGELASATSSLNDATDNHFSVCTFCRSLQRKGTTHHGSILWIHRISAHFHGDVVHDAALENVPVHLVLDALQPLCLLRAPLEVAVHEEQSGAITLGGDLGVCQGNEAVEISHDKP